MPSDNVACAYCGLPVVVSKSEPSSNDQAFCCLGCRIASEIMGDDATEGSRWAAARLGMAIFFTMNVMVFTMVLWTWNVHEITPDSRVEAFRGILRYACLLFATPVYVLLGGPLFEASVEALGQRRFTTDVLLFVGVCAAFLYSTCSLLLGLPDVYFEVACMILVAVTLGKWMEATAKQKATNSIRSLRRLLPEQVRVVAGGRDRMIPISEVAVGVLLRILPGERIPVDCVVESETCDVDEQIITGESLPQSKVRGQPVFGGTLNLSRDLRARATSTADSGAIARLVAAVETATSSVDCQPIRLADRLAAWFLPLVVVSATVAFFLHVSDGLHHGLMTSLSVVLIACPCALGIATPLVLWVAINTAAQRGVVFRNGDAILQLARIDSVALDKTGTITTGKATVASQTLADGSDLVRFKLFSKQLAGSSNHVLSKAVEAYAADEAGQASGVESLFTQDGETRDQTGVLTSIEDHPGRGVTGNLANGSRALLGSLRFASEMGMHVPPELATAVKIDAAHATVWVGWEGEVRGIFSLADSLRDESKQVIAALQGLGLQLVVLTGDNAERAAEMERFTGVETLGNLLPDDKVVALSRLPGVVAMVGDGINDALALAKADVGIAMDCGADVSRDTADICLLGSSLVNLPWAIELSRHVRKTIRYNLAWAVVYNLVGIGFAISGNLNPIIAAIAMVGSSVLVLTNSLRLATSVNGADAAFDIDRGTHGHQADLDPLPDARPVLLEASSR